MGRGRCKIINCPTRKAVNCSVSMFSVPSEPKPRKIWIDIIEKYQEFDYIPQSYQLCELHFDPKDIIRTERRTQLMTGRVPKYFENLNLDRLKNLELDSKQKKIRKIDIHKETNVNFEPNFDFVSVDSIVKSESNTIPIEYEYNGLMTESLSVRDASTQTEPVDSNLKNGTFHSSTSTKAVQSQRLPQSKNHTANSSSNENEMTVCISQREYTRLLHNDVEYLRVKANVNSLKSKCLTKSVQIKQLQDAVSYYKKRISSFTKSLQQK